MITQGFSYVHFVSFRNERYREPNSHAEYVFMPFYRTKVIMLIRLNVLNGLSDFTFFG